jgi:transposase
MRDELGVLYTDEAFAPLFPADGQPALAPWRLALVTIMQFVEGLSDRQAADAVRARLDWKYALGLEVEDCGFDFSVLSEFRTRLVDGQAEYLLFETLLAAFKERGLLQAGGRQRTDATHVLAKVRALNRLVCVGETLRAALNSLAVVVPEWLQAFAPAEWHERYDHRVEEHRLPKDRAERAAFAETIGADGQALLTALGSTPALAWLHQVPAVQTLRQVWVQQFEVVEGRVRFRGDDNIPPPAQLICSPYDVQATYGRKRDTWWVGYKVHVTETCDEDKPRLITHVETSRAGNGDVDVTPLIHRALQAKALLPRQHLTDTNYAEAKQFLQSERDHGIDLVAPTRADHKWQAQQRHGYDANSFLVDWQAHQATCPAGHTSLSWTPAIDRRDNQVVKIKFSRKDCLPCPSRSHCTKAKRRAITLRAEEVHLALQRARARQKDPDFWQTYRWRAGIEGSLSQGVRAFGLRRSRYEGTAKTHLQHLACAAAINVVRVVAWLEERPLATTRRSHFAALVA